MADHRALVRQIRIAILLLFIPLAGCVDAAPAPLQITETLITPIPQRIVARWAGTGQEQRAVRIARCESGFNPGAKNRRSSAYGLFQFLDGTWRSTGIAKTSDPDLQIEAAFRLWKQRGWQPWVCRG